MAVAARIGGEHVRVLRDGQRLFSGDQGFHGTRLMGAEPAISTDGVLVRDDCDGIGQGTVGIELVKAATLKDNAGAPKAAGAPEADGQAG